MKREEIIDAYLFLIKNNHSIPDATLDFMKDVSLREFEKITTGSGCFSCRHDGFQMLHPSACTGCGAEGELRNFQIKI